MIVHLASDHAGFTHKEAVKRALESAERYTIVDHGPISFDADDDYPPLIARAARAVSADESSVGIVFGGSGQGEAIVANRFSRVRAVVYYGGPSDIITLSRQHNNANILSLGARFMSEREAITCVEAWLSTPFSGDERHVRRIAEIENVATEQ